MAALALAMVSLSCDPQQLAREGGGDRRLSIATGGTGGVYYPYGGALARLITDHVDGVAATAEVTAASVDNLKLLGSGQVDLAFTLADTLAEAAAGKGPFVETGPVAARALAVLYRNYTHVVTLAGSGITSIDDLRGRVVSTGAPGSGTELVALRILAAAGLGEADFSGHALGAQGSADGLRDGKLDAFFWSGGLPTAAILDLASTPGRPITLIPNDAVAKALEREHGDGLYERIAIPRGAYPGLEHDVPVVGVPNVLVVHAQLEEELAGAITRLLFERRQDLVAIHPEARHLELASAAGGAPVPYHPGAVRYYREQQVWPR